MDISGFRNEWLVKGKVDFDGKYGAQCVDLVRQYFFQCFGLGDRAGGVAYAINYWTATPAGVLEKFDRVQTSSPLAGDVVVLRTAGRTDLEGAGHIGIATGAINGANFEMLEQNGQTGSGSGTGPDAIRTRYIARSRILGVLRPKAATPPPAAPLPVLDPMPAGEFFNLPKGRNFWGLEEDWKLPHGTLQALNPGLDPRKIPVNYPIRIRAAAAAPAPAPAAPAGMPGGDFYTMQKGDNFWALEEAWGLTHGTLQTLNPTLVPRQIPNGASIRIRPEIVVPPAAPAVPDPAPVVPPEAPAVPETAAPVPLPAVSEPAIVETPAQPQIVAPATPEQLQKMFPDLDIREFKDKNWFQRTFTSDKIIKDLSALGLLLAGVLAWFGENKEMIGPIFTLLSGLLFRSNRIKK